MNVKTLHKLMLPVPLLFWLSVASMFTERDTVERHCRQSLDPEVDRGQCSSRTAHDVTFPHDFVRR